jgi:hypothetical protein
MLANRYAAAILSIAVIVLTAFLAIPEDQRDAPTLWQFTALAISSGTVYLLPLLDGKWAGLLKTGSAVVLAVIGALIPLLSTGTLSATQWLVLLLAGLNALATEIGVKLRKDSTVARHAIVKDGVALITSVTPGRAIPADGSAPEIGADGIQVLR